MQWIVLYCWCLVGLCTGSVLYGAQPPDIALRARLTAAAFSRPSLNPVEEENEATDDDQSSQRSAGSRPSAPTPTPSPVSAAFRRSSRSSSLLSPISPPYRTDEKGNRISTPCPWQQLPCNDTQTKSDQTDLTGAEQKGESPETEA